MSSVPSSDGRVDLSHLRKPYRDSSEAVKEDALPSLNPVKLFENWFNLVKESESVYEPNAVCVSTVNAEGRPSSRMVLLKGFGDDGFRFFTHYTSQKGRELEQNPNIALLFYWDSFNRQVRIEGKAHKLPQEDVEAYFKRRPKTSQLGAAISDQCSLISDRKALMDRYHALEKKIGDGDVPKPEKWGGFLVVPDKFEFWQGNTDRVHDRLIFRKSGPNETINPQLTKPAENCWVLERMLP
ncbi:Pyridoxine-5'-phosphate oxidase, partial [Fragariocoptes setiger]